MQNFAGGQIFAASRVQTDFSFDAGGNRARQLKQRLNSDTSSLVEETTYLGSYEREVHSTKSAPAAPMVLTRTVHRHSIGGFAVYTRTVKPSLPSETKLTTILKDHLGSTDLLYTGTWTGSSFSTPTPASIERQSFDPWGERRAPDTLVSYRTSDTDAFRASAQDYDRGYTGHEQLDDSGLIHMNGRIYDPELGRMLSPDPFVQVPEYSQNFNRYSYVMNNPLNLTDPSGFSWLSKAFKKIGSWFKENWRTIVSIVFAAILFVVIGPGSFMGMFSGSLFSSGWAVGASIGALSGAFNAAINGGNFGDILRGAVIGGIQGGIAGDLLHGLGEAAAEAGGFFTKEAAMHIAGHGLVGGAANEAMGGKFADGFISAAAAAGASYFGPFQNTKGATGVVGRTIQAGIVGGTASALGRGKFANGAYTAAFQHLLNAETLTESSSDPGEVADDGSPRELFGDSAQIDKMASGGKPFLYAYWYNSRNGTNMLTGVIGLFDKNGLILGTWRINSGGFGKGAIPSNMEKGWDSYKHLKYSELKGGNLWKSLTGTQNGIGYTRDNYSFKFWIETDYKTTGRTAILFHPDGGSKGTQGCIGIDHGYQGVKSFHDKFILNSKNGIRVYVE